MKRLISVVLLLSLGCSWPAPKPDAPPLQYHTFGETLSLIETNTDAVVLKNGKQQVIVTPEFAGRVMGSTYNGAEGLCMGWFNPPVIKGEEKDEHFVNYGGAERLWLSPEGGQYALYFKPETDFKFADWYVPPSFNNTPFPVIDTSESHIVMQKDVELVNWSNTPFTLELKRTVSLIPRIELNAAFGITAIPENIHFVAYKSTNVMRNTADKPMTKAGGLISLWVLCQYYTEGQLTVIAPYLPDEKGGSGPIVKSDYFGEVPEDRLQVLDTPPVILFKADAGLRTKIGISPQRTTGVIGSIDWKRSILTIAKTPHVDPNGLYANNAWEFQQQPYQGDAINSYSDGPRGMNTRFYELETLSPTRELKPAEAITHEHRTIHLQGPLPALNAIAQQTLGVDLTKIPRL